MHKPKNLKTKIFLDGGDPSETRAVLSALGFLDGQTTNPTLIAKNPEAQARLARGEKFSKDEVFDFYRTVVSEISSLIPNGSVSVEVYADASTPSDDMFMQGEDMFSWIPNAHIKYPITAAGLSAANRSIKKGKRVNMTLCFTEAQAAAVYAATAGASRGDVFVSPFIGRLDDRKENGMDLIKNILRMYHAGNGHVEVLTASVRSMEHFMAALAVGSDIITSPASILLEWAKEGTPLPDESFSYEKPDLAPIAYRGTPLTKGADEYDITHELTDKGIARFSEDWNNLIG